MAYSANRHTKSLVNDVDLIRPLLMDVDQPRHGRLYKIHGSVRHPRRHNLCGQY